jgi:hypothetical protein
MQGQPYGSLAGQTMTKDSGGYRIGGARVLDRYDNLGAYVAGGGGRTGQDVSGLWDVAGLDKDLLARQRAIEAKNDKSWAAESGSFSGGDSDGVTRYAPPPTAAEAKQADDYAKAMATLESKYQMVRLGHGQNENDRTRRVAYIDRSTGQVVDDANPYAHSGSRDAAIQAAALAAMAATAGGAGAALGGALGASGSMATALGNGIIQGSVSGLQGGNVVKGALTGALGAGASGLGGLASGAVGGGLTGTLLGGAVSGATNAAGRGLLNGGLSGSNIARGALTGVASAGANQLGNWAGGAIGGGLAGKALSGAISGGLNTVSRGLISGRGVDGGEVGRNALMGGARGALGSVGSMIANRLGQPSNGAQQPPQPRPAAQQFRPPTREQFAQLNPQQQQQVRQQMMRMMQQQSPRGT